MRKGTFYMLLALFFLAAGPLTGSVTAGELDRLRERIEINEARLEDIEDGDSNFMDISGYVDTEYIFTDRAADTSHFRLHHLSLQFSKDLSEKWSFFSEIEFEDGAFFEAKNDGTTDLDKAEGAILIETMYVDMELNEYLNLRIGRYLDPAGIWNVDHYVPFVTTQDRPKHIRKIFPKYLDGLQAFGSRPVGANHLSEYKLYVGNGSGESGKLDTNENKTVGASVNLKFLSLYDLDIGLSYLTGKDSSNVDIDAIGFDAKFRIKDFSFQTEYGHADRTADSTNVETERSGWYAQGVYDIKQVSLVYRYDTYKDTEPGEPDTDTNTVAFNYHFTPKIVGKVENHFIAPDNTGKYYKGIVSIAVFLGG